MPAARRSVRQAMQGATFSGEAAPDLGAQDERQPSAGHVELPARAAVPGHGEDPERRRVAGDPVEQAEPGQAGQRDGAATRIVVEESEGRGPRARATPAASTGSSGSTAGRRACRRHRAPRPRASSAWIAWTSRNPRSQRDGSGTRRSTADPPSAWTSTADAPTDRPSSLRSCTPARAARTPGPKVDVRRAASQDLAVVRLGQQVDPAVDAAAGRERLEPEAIVGTRHDGIGELQDALEHLRGHVEPRAGHVAEGEQQVGGHDRQEQSAAEELGVRRRTTRCREPEPASIALADERRRERVAIRLLEDRRRESHRGRQ